MAGIRRFIAVIDAVNEWTGKVVLYFVPLLMLVVVYGVIMRYVFNRATLWGLETSQFMFCAIIALAGGYTLLHGRHVNVEIVHGRLRTRAKAIAGIITAPVLLGFIALLFQQTTEVTIDSYRWWQHAPTYWAPLLFPIYTLMAIGVALILLQALAILMRNVITAITGVAVTGKPEEKHE